MTAVPFVQVPLTLANAFAFHVCMSPPAATLPPTNRDNETSKESDIRIYVIARFITSMITKGFYAVSAIMDAFFLLAPHFSTSFRLVSIPIPTSITLSMGPLLWTQQLVLRPTLPSLTVIGAALVLAGTLLRSSAYRALGQFYACPPCLGPCPSPTRGPGPYTPQGARHGHALITSGPYAFLRHPGYAGLLLSMIGFVILHLDYHDARSIVSVPRWGIGVNGGVNVGQACVMMRTVALFGALLGAVGAVRRIPFEEQALKERFKVDWEVWAEAVGYKLIPGVY